MVSTCVVYFIFASLEHEHLEKPCQGYIKDLAKKSFGSSGKDRLDCYFLMILIPKWLHRHLRE